MGRIRQLLLATAAVAALALAPRAEAMPMISLQLDDLSTPGIDVSLTDLGGTGLLTHIGGIGNWIVNVTTGTALELLSTAAGRVFAAWMPKKVVTPLIAEELKSAKLPPELKSRAAVEALLGEIRAQGYAATNGQHKVAGVEAAAAPVFNFKNEITMAVLVVGVQGMLDISPEGEVIKSLKRHAEALSLRLGAHGDPKLPA